ncbi:GapA-binding peptide SR1P [Metabacillus sediminilitoris]|nr:GapA-binding peptide SR1P [Metabacillus sediminilitoris]
MHTIIEQFEDEKVSTLYGQCSCSNKTKENESN